MTPQAQAEELAKRIAEITSRVRFATHGPWRRGSSFGQANSDDARCVIAPEGTFGEESRVVAHEMSHDEQWKADMGFIAHAREDIPWLLEQLANADAAATERAAEIAENPYGDEVEALGSNEPAEVGRKIAKAIRAKKSAEET